MLISRREFLKYCSAAAGALGLSATGLVRLQDALAAEDGPSVIWLQGQGCTGCSTSLLNTIHYATIDDLLLNTIDLEFHSTVMAAAGEMAADAAEAACDTGGYVLVVEGAIPTAHGGMYCTLWPEMTMVDAVRRFSRKAALILAVGTCAAYGGIPGGSPNPTRAKGVRDVLGARSVVNLPGCPAHPDWIVGTIAHILAHGEAPAVDGDGRPTAFYRDSIHSKCPNLAKYLDGQCYAGALGEPGCLYHLGCEGKWTVADCPTRRWNGGEAGALGVNWCIGAGNPCQGCTEPTFPDGVSPFYTLEGKPKLH
jgi:hydrogenase small subunit